MSPNMMAGVHPRALTITRPPYHLQGLEHRILILVIHLMALVHRDTKDHRIQTQQRAAEKIKYKGTSSAFRGRN